MAWVELAVFGLVLLMAACIFLRPYPKDEKKPEETSDAQSVSNSVSEHTGELSPDSTKAQRPDVAKVEGSSEHHSMDRN